VKIHDAVFHSRETERLRLHEGLFDRFSAANQYRLPVKTLTLHKCFNYEILHPRQAVVYLGFCEGGARAKDARFEAPEAPMGWSVGRGCPLPTEKGVWGGGCARSPEI